MKCRGSTVAKSTELGDVAGAVGCNHGGEPERSSRLNEQVMIEDEITPIEAIMAVFGVDEVEARFMKAIESGEIDGDVICIDDDSLHETQDGDGQDE